MDGRVLASRQTRPTLFRGIMNIAILIRQRLLQGCALQNAAQYDAAELRRQGHKVQVIALTKIEIPDPRKLRDFDVVVIEGAGWVNPLELAKICKGARRCIVRVHAAPEFLYWEYPGVSSLRYIREARAMGAEIAYVSDRLAFQLAGAFLPINYPVGERKDSHSSAKGFDVGCFGAIRPLKNHVGQLLALGAVRAHIKQPNVYFHINSTRIEGTAFILTELEEIARELDIHLVKHDWFDTETFKTDIIPSMDLGLFASFAESFCITAADFVSAGVPSVLSNHIPWAHSRFCGTTTESIASAVRSTLEDPAWVASENLKDLREYSATASEAWSTALSKGVYA